MEFISCGLLALSQHSAPPMFQELFAAKVQLMIFGCEA